MKGVKEVLQHVRDQYYKAAMYCQIGQDVEGIHVLLELDKLNELPVYVLGFHHLEPRLFTDAVAHINQLIASSDSVGLADYILYEFLPFYDELIALGAEVDSEQ